MNNMDCVILTIIAESVKIKFDSMKTVMVSMTRVGSPAVTGLCGNHNANINGKFLTRLIAAKLVLNTESFLKLDHTSL